MNEKEKIINFTTFNSFLHYGVKGMKWGVINEEERQNNIYGSRGQFNVAMEGREKHVTGQGKPIAKRGQGLGSSEPSQDMVNMQNRQTPANTVKPVDNEYEQRKKEYAQISSDIERYENAFKSIDDMDPKYQEQLFNRYKGKLLDLVSKHQEVMGYKPYTVNNAADMKKFFKFYHDARKAEGYV